MKKLLIASAFLMLADASEALTLRIACRAKGIELSLIKELIDEWTKESGVDVEVISLPHASNECFGLYKQLLSSNRCDLDIVAMDVAWISAFANKLEDLLEHEGIDESVTNGYFDAIKSTLMNDGRLIALSLYTDIGLLFYRKDLLQKYGYRVPRSFDELYSTAFHIQMKEREAGNQHIHGYVFSGKAAEDLMCVANDVIHAYGSSFVENGVSNLQDERFFNAMNFIIRSARDIAPVGLPNHNQEDSRGIFQIGNAVFMRNWPYAAVVADAPGMENKVGIASLPAGTLGGWNLGVPKLSTNKKYAVSLLKHLTSRHAQKLRAMKGHYAPAYQDLYCDEDILKYNHKFCYIKEALKNAKRRPSLEFGTQYQKASTIFVSFLNTAISKAKNRKYNLKRALRVTNKRLDVLLQKAKNANTNKS